MNAHKVSVTLTADGELTLKGLPFQAGETVKVIVLEEAKKSQPSSLSDQENYPKPKYFPELLLNLSAIALRYSNSK